MSSNTGLTRLGASGILTLAVAASACLIAGAQEVVLVKDGAPAIGIVLPDKPEGDETLAAQELRHFIERISGGQLALATADAKGPKLYLGRASAFPNLAVEAPNLAAEQYLIQAAGDRVYLLGGSARGALWAVYGVLHELGCRWYMPGEMGEVVPKRATLAINGARRIEGPAFPYRGIWYSWGGPPDCGPRFSEWQRRNRLGFPAVQHGHNLTTSMPADASFEKRPELYALVNGTRMKTQVCTSNPEVIALITETVNAYFDAHPDVLCYSLCPDDNGDFCECDTCRALDAGGMEETGKKPIVTDRYITFLDAVVEGVQKAHPGKMVSTYAYINYSTPPVRTPISPYVVVFFTASVYCGGHGIGDATCASRMKMKSDLEGWTKVCPNVYIYEYDPIPGNAELPWPLFGARVREMPVYRWRGIKGLSIESHCSWATLLPNHWVSAQCLWNPDRTVDDLLRDYCEGFFGLSDKAARAQIFERMMTYYRALEGALAKHAPKIEWGRREIPDIYTPDVVQQCRAALDDAMKLAGATAAPEKDHVLARLRTLNLGFTYLEKYLECVRLVREGGDFQALQKAYAECKKLIDDMVAAAPDFIEVHSSFPGIREEFAEKIALRFPKDLALVTEWNAIGPFDNAGNAGHDKLFPPEQAIDLDAEYPGLTGPVKWHAISSGAQGYVNLLDHFTPKDWVTVYLLDYVHADRDMDVQFRLGSNDTVKVWLDGKLVWRYDEGRQAVMDDDIVPVHLKAGSSPLLLKVSQTGRDWGIYFRITDAEGQVVPAVRVSTGDAKPVTPQSASTATSAPSGSGSDWDMLTAKPEMVEAWRDMHFGMFICWGPVTLTGLEIGWSRGKARPDQEQGGGGPTPVEVYDDLYKKWRPDQFDAREWVKAAQDAGARYIIFLVKHHDGFSLFDTKLTDYRSTGPQSAWKVDVLEAVADACHEADMKLIVYYSPPDWRHPEYRTANHARYIEYLHGQIREILSNYGRIDGLWFDGLGGSARDWDAETLFKLARGIQPWLVINNRCGLPGDFDTPEQQLGRFQVARPWETCMTLGTQWSWKPDDTIKPLKECIDALVTCACRGGNLALNTNPMPDGRIEPRQADRFREIGQWLRKYGESIYATRGGPFRGACKWGGATNRGDIIYVHVLTWPGEILRLPALAKTITASSILTRGTATVTQTSQGIEIAVPARDRQELDTIIALKLDGPAADIKPIAIPSGSLTLGKKATASSIWGPGYEADAAFDEDQATRWGAAPDSRSGWLEVDLGADATFCRAVVNEDGWNRVEEYELQSWDGASWHTFFRAARTRATDVSFPPVTARNVRLNILHASDVPTIWEFQLFKE